VAGGGVSKKAMRKQAQKQGRWDVRKIIGALAGSPERLVRLAEQTKRFSASAPRLAASQQFEELARLGAEQGAMYMQQDIADGVPNDEYGFAPEFHLFKNGKLLEVIATPGCGKILDEIRQMLFKKKPDVILQISSAWYSKTAATNKAQPSKQTDRITISHGAVYTAAKEKVAGWMIPVGSEEDLARAGVGEAA